VITSGDQIAAQGASDDYHGAATPLSSYTIQIPFAPTRSQKAILDGLILTNNGTENAVESRSVLSVAQRPTTIN